MGNLEEKLLHASHLYQTRIKKFCSPILNHFGITHFYLYKITNAGKFFVLSNNLPWAEYYLASHLLSNQPHFRHPDNYQSCIYMLKTATPLPEFEDTVHNAREKFNLNFCMQIIDKVADGVEIYGFDVSTPGRSHDLLLLNEINLLRLFIKRFRESNPMIFEKLIEEEIDIAKLVGPDFYQLSSPISSVLTTRSAFLEEIGMSPAKNLSKRELEVINDVYKGLSAGQIASKHFISKRTVEHHIERIKDKLLCQSKVELFEQIRELELLGYLNR